MEGWMETVFHFSINLNGMEGSVFCSLWLSCKPLTPSPPPTWAVKKIIFCTFNPSKAVYFLQSTASKLMTWKHIPSRVVFKMDLEGSGCDVPRSRSINYSTPLASWLCKLLKMEDFTLSNLPSFPSATQVTGMEYWERAMLYDMEMMMLKPTLEKFGGDCKATLTHLCQVHTESCGCHIGPDHEAANKIWNEKKVPFMELHKQSGLDFDDYLNR